MKEIFIERIHMFLSSILLIDVIQRNILFHVIGQPDYQFFVIGQIRSLHIGSNANFLYAWAYRIWDILETKDYGNGMPQRN